MSGVVERAEEHKINEVFVARQPICALNQKTLGYELLFRNSFENRAVIGDADLATAQVIVNSFMEIGLDKIVGSSLAFINVTREFILGDNCRSLPSDRVVLEILEDTIPDLELINALTALSAAGYRFALDDFDFGPRTRPLIPFCDFVKVDLRAVQRANIEDQLRSLVKVKLLAEKVETQEEYDFCKRVGFEYFQGYYFCKPHIVHGTKIPTNKVSLFRLLAKLSDPEVSSRDIETVVSEDVSLSYRLLRYINSAYVGLKKKVDSVAHAVRMVGTEHIRRLASLIMLTSIDGKPRELVVLSLVRAKMCELVAMRMGFPHKDAFFTVGLFSTLDAFLDCSMVEAMDKLPLSDEIHKALIEGTGHLGEVLQCVIAYERAQLDPRKIKLDSISLRNAYIESVGWGDQFITRLPS
jgi:EAL and modified HD-GYP domain-containing signal transduction protein